MFGDNVVKKVKDMILKHEVKLAVKRLYPGYKHGSFKGDFDTFSFRTVDGETHTGKVSMSSLVVVVDGSYVEPL